jgi:hypothetical protein
MLRQTLVVVFGLATLLALLLALKFAGPGEAATPEKARRAARSAPGPSSDDRPYRTGCNNCDFPTP